MAIVKRNRLWNGIQTRQEINTETARIEVFSIGGGFFGVDVLLASSDGIGSDWKINNPQSFTDIYNKINNTRSTVKELERAFFLQGYKVFDSDRARVLNANSTYEDNPREGLISRQRFYNQGTPGMKDPSTNKEVNLDGITTTEEIKPRQTDNNADISESDKPEEISSENSEQVETFQEIDNNTGSTDKASPTKIKLKKQNLRYPTYSLDNLGVSFDYIQFTAVEYVGSLNGSFDGVPSTGGAVNFPGASTRYSDKEKNLDTVILPMVPSISQTNGISWGAGNMNAIEAFLGKGVFDALGTIGESGVLSKELRKSVTDTLGAGGSMIKGLGTDKQEIAAVLAGYVLGNTSISSRTSGAVINPNMELLFSGPQLRSFNFTFKFAPRFKDEAEQVIKICRSFKYNAAPKISENGAIFLKTPNIYKLKYMTSDGQPNVYVNMIKPCALTAVQVNYTPGGTYMTYEDGAMTQTTLTLSFQELEPIYDIDYEGKNGYNNHKTGY